MKKKRIAEIVFKYSYLLVIAIVFSVALSKLTVEGSQIISVAIDKVLKVEQLDIVRIFFEMGIIILAAALLAFLKSEFNELFSIKLQQECKNIMIEAIARSKYCLFEKNAGTVINKLSTDIRDMGILLSEILPDIVQHIVYIIVFGWAIIKLNRTIFIGIIIVLPIVLFCSNKIAEKINTLAQNRKGKYDELSEIGLDNISGIETAKAYLIEETLNWRVEVKIKEILKNEYARNRYQALANALESLLKWLPTVICSLLALLQVVKGVITVGDFMAFLILFEKISTPISELPFRIIEAGEMMISVKRIEKLMNTPQEECGNTNESVNAENIIELRNVSFAYETADILKSINMIVKKGEKIAIVGTSGAGKSTLLKLLCGFYRPTSGEYRFCGHNFDEWNIASVRKQMALVPQDSYLFPGTVMENITYGSTKSDLQKVKNVCKSAGIYQTIANLPQQFDTDIGEKGIKMSGGERQRIAIARAILKDAPIIVMDEATSALDNESEKLIAESVAGMKNIKTVILIAHRKTTIERADEMVIIN